MTGILTPLEGEDHAQSFLVPYLQRTERLFEAALKSLDPQAHCRITPAADLCFPHDVVRIAGGFGTGCLVEWQCSVPVIPIDTTVNIDITSLFRTSDTLSDVFSEEFFATLRKTIEDESSYEWNFHKGNHFIAAVQRESDGAPALFFHSNEKEFKYQFNGLMPVPGNWFWDDVRVFNDGDRYIRLLVGDRAELFYQFSRMLHEFTELRHAFLADRIRGEVRVTSAEHKFHYYMPNAQAVAIGCYLCDAGDEVPILSRPGRPIDIFKAAAGGRNSVSLLAGGEKLIVPHGWGKTSLDPVLVSFGEKTFSINGMSFPIEPKATLGIHPGLVLRDFADAASDSGSIFRRMAQHCPGQVVDRLQQCAWYNKDGTRRA